MLTHEMVGAVVKSLKDVMLFSEQEHVLLLTVESSMHTAYVRRVVELRVSAFSRRLCSENFTVQRLRLQGESLLAVRCMYIRLMTQAGLHLADITWQCFRHPAVLRQEIRKALYR